MKKNNIFIWVLVIIIILGLGIYLSHSKNKNVSTTTTPDTTTSPKNTPTTNDTAIIYNNADYGFTFSLPVDWKGYSIVNSTWQGYSQTNTNAQTGVKLLIRNPNWTSEKHYEDIPIMIFTISQWNSYSAGDFYTSAAPFPASELARNNLYVFAIPPRWDYDYSQGYEEADNILTTKPLHPFNL